MDSRPISDSEAETTRFVASGPTCSVYICITNSPRLHVAGMYEPLFDLTSFQRDLLYVIAGASEPSGQEIKAELQAPMGEITHGRLYPNLNTLVKKEYVEKGQHDRRTNLYRITKKGRESLKTRREWEDQYVDL